MRSLHFEVYELYKVQKDKLENIQLHVQDKEKNKLHFHR